MKGFISVLLVAVVFFNATNANFFGLFEPSNNDQKRNAWDLNDFYRQLSFAPSGGNDWDDIWRPAETAEDEYDDSYSNLPFTEPEVRRQARIGDDDIIAQLGREFEFRN